MAYSLEALKELIKNSPSIKGLPPRYKRRIMKSIKAPDIAQRRELYFLLLQEKQKSDQINERFMNSAQKIYGQFVTGLNYLTKKYKIN